MLEILEAFICKKRVPENKYIETPLNTSIYVSDSTSDCW